MTRRAAASIVFGLGSFLLMADMVVVVLGNGDEGGSIFDMGFPGVLAYIGLLLWLVGIFLLMIHLKDRSPKKASSVKPVFLHGRRSFKCVSCGARIDCSKVSFHDRKTCRCGKLYDIYEDDRTEGI